MEKIPRILIIDDSNMIIDRLKLFLTGLQPVFLIHQAGNYEEAIEKLKKQLPDVLLLDINLPGKSGIEVLRYLNRHALLIKTIIVVSNHAEQYYRDLCLDLGAHYYIDKSNEFEKIPELISRYG